MTIKGVPVAQAATVAFEAAVSEAVFAETGDYIVDDATVLVSEDLCLPYVHLGRRRRTFRCASATVTSSIYVYILLS